MIIKSQVTREFLMHYTLAFQNNMTFKIIFQ